jgi:hypothetical protein
MPVVPKVQKRFASSVSTRVMHSAHSVSSERFGRCRHLGRPRTTRDVHTRCRHRLSTRTHARTSPLHFTVPSGKSCADHEHLLLLTPLPSTLLIPGSPSSHRPLTGSSLAPASIGPRGCLLLITPPFCGSLSFDLRARSMSIRRCHWYNATAPSRFIRQ